MSLFGMPLLLMAIIAIALIFDFLKGLHDSSNIVTTMISSRAFFPQRALSMTAVAQFAGPFLFGVTVATTIGVRWWTRRPSAAPSCGTWSRGTLAGRAALLMRSSAG